MLCARNLYESISFTIVKIGGIEHVGLGPDFADYLFQYMTKAENEGVSLDVIRPVQGLSGDKDIPKIAQELERRGYNPTEIDLIMGENFMRIFREIL